PSASGAPCRTCRSSSAAASPPRRSPSSSPSRTGRSSAPPSSVATTCEIPSTGGGWSGSLPRLVALSLLVLAAAGCRTYPPLEPGRLAALGAELGPLLPAGFERTAAGGNGAVER